MQRSTNKIRAASAIIVLFVFVATIIGVAVLDDDDDNVARRGSSDKQETRELEQQRQRQLQLFRFFCRMRLRRCERQLEDALDACPGMSLEGDSDVDEDYVTGNQIFSFFQGSCPTDLEDCQEALRGALLCRTTESPTPSPTVPSDGQKATTSPTADDGVYRKSSIRIAYFGNSFTFYYSSHRIVHQMLQLEGYNSTYDTCFAGGNNFTGLTVNGCPEWFGAIDGSVNSHEWDFVVMNDHPQRPIYQDKEMSKEELRKSYAPLFFGTASNSDYQQFPIPVLISTHAYRVLGLFGTPPDFDTFTDRLAQGYQEYADVLDEEAVSASGRADLQIARIAPNGEGYRWLYHNNNELWYKLYDDDNFHPSACGSLLLAFTLYITITGKAPPTFDPEWFDPKFENYTMPTLAEGATLRAVAARVTNFTL